MEAPTKEGWSGHTDSEAAHSVVGRDVLVLVGAGLAYAANTYPAHYLASKGRGPPG